ncbi:MAG: SGNH/GDSL hydrolase family protein [Pseudomonadales bacterium]
MNAVEVKEAIGNTVVAVGALDFDHRKTGIAPRRLPAWTRDQVPTPMDAMLRMPSGVRLRFSTDAARVGLHFLASAIASSPEQRRSINLNLECEGELWSARSNAGNTIVINPEDPSGYQLARGDSDTVWFSDLPEHDKTCEIWLPHNAFIELRELVVDDDKYIRSPAADERKRWIHYGSSISHCMEAEQPAYIWPAVAAREAGVTLLNLGFGGQCHLDQFVARTIRDADADIISIKVGINIINMDSMRERVFVPALHGFLDTIRERKPKTPTVLISPIFCPSAEHHPGPMVPNAEGKFVTLDGHSELRAGCMSLSRVRELIEDTVERRADNNLGYLNGLDLFGEADAPDLPDDLHPNPKGYIRMGHRFAQLKLTSLASSAPR